MRAPKAAARVLSFGLGLALALAGCQGKLRRADESGERESLRSDDEQAAWDALDAEEDSGAYASESDRTAAMEAKAAEAQRIYDEAMANAQTPEEQMRAYQEFEDARREVNAIAEGESGEGDDAYAPPP